MKISIKRILWLCGLCLAVWLGSCAPAIKTGVIHTRPALPDSVDLVILELADSLRGQPAERIGNVHFGDKGLSVNCHYAAEMEMLKGIARSKGANLIKITAHRDPDAFSSCDRISADLYYDADNHRFEQQFEWSSRRRLQWRDFKKQDNSGADSSEAAVTSTGIKFSAAAPTAFSKADYSVRAYMDCTASWVRHDQQYRADLLGHEQGHFDISELFARKLRQRLKQAGLRSFNLNPEGGRLFREINRELFRFQQKYDTETRHGLKQEKQVEWQAQIEKALQELSIYEDKTI